MKIKHIESPPKTSLFFIGIVLVMTVMVYAQMYSHEFITFDDNDYITKNPHIQNGLTLEGIKWSFQKYYVGNWHPLTWISHMLDIHLFGYHAGAHHLVNLFFHCLNTFFLFYLLSSLTGQPFQSLLVAALFALHPIHVEAVAWASERKEVLGTFWGIVSLICYGYYCKNTNIFRYLTIVLTLGLSLMAKQMTVTFPFVMLLLDIWPLKRIPLVFPICWKQIGQCLTEKIPLFMLSGLACLIVYLAQESGGSITTLEKISLLSRINHAGFSYFFYIFKMVWPFNFALFYPYIEGITVWHMTLVFGMLFFISIGTLYYFKSHPHLFVGWFWFIGTCVPIIGLVRIGSQAFADRYTYVPLIGLFIMIAWHIPILLKQLYLKKTFFLGLSIIYFIFLSSITYINVSYWKNSHRIYEHALMVTKRNFLIHNSLGNVLLLDNQIDKAIIHFKKALEYHPKNADAYNNLGVAYLKNGQVDKAIDAFKKALDIFPQHATAAANLHKARHISKKGNVHVGVSN